MPASIELKRRLRWADAGAAGRTSRALAEPALAQEQQPRTDEVLRSKTELIQTYVTIVDQKGKFVDG